MESPFFCSRIHPFNAQTRSSKRLKPRGTRKVTKENDETRGNWAGTIVAATTTRGGPHGWALVASGLFGPASPLRYVLVHLLGS